MRLLILPLAASVLAACTTTPIPLTEATFISDQLAYRDAAPGTVPVTIRRDRGFFGAGCKARVYVNGELAASLGTGEAVTLNVPAGDVIIGADPGAICAGGLVEQAATLAPDKPIFLRVARDQSGNFNFLRTMGR